MHQPVSFFSSLHWLHWWMGLPRNWRDFLLRQDYMKVVDVRVLLPLPPRWLTSYFLYSCPSFLYYYSVSSCLSCNQLLFLSFPSLPSKSTFPHPYFFYLLITNTTRLSQERQQLRHWTLFRSSTKEWSICRRLWMVNWVRSPLCWKESSSSPEKGCCGTRKERTCIIFWQETCC